MNGKKLTFCLAGNANVGKSLSGDTRVFVCCNGRWKIVRLKDLAEDFFSRSNVTRVDESDFATPHCLFVVSLNLGTLRTERAKVTRILRHRERRKLVQITTSSGRALTATRDHNFVVLRNGVPNAVDAECLVVGDQIPLVERLSLERSEPLLDLGKYLSEKIRSDHGQYQISDEFVIVHGKRIPRHIMIDENWAGFFGLYLAEGCLTQSSRVPRISTSEEDITNFIENHLESWNIPYHTTRNLRKNAYNIGISKVLTPVLQEFGGNSGEKVIPHFVYQWNEELIKGLLKGYFRGYGWKQATAIHASTKSEKLQLGLAILLSITKKHSRLNVKQVDRNPYYEIRYVPKPSRKRSQWLERLNGIGVLLKQARKSTGLTQKEVVNKLGWKAVKGSYISALESERRKITKRFLQRLVSLYRKHVKGSDSTLELLERLAFADVVWDEVIEIRETCAEDEHVYDLVVQGNENFMLANGIFVHNSVIFNHLTGLHQHTGNWPGKTVERAEGTLHFRGYTIDIIDLPGIYSLSTFSMEELVSREYIATEKPDLVINVVDASILERNLFFTLQLMELETPLILALNQIDVARSKGIEIDLDKLQEALGVPVIPTVAVRGVGVYELLEKAVEVVERGGARPLAVSYGEEVERRVAELAAKVGRVQRRYPTRYVAIKLLEGDAEIEKEVREISPEVLSTAKRFADEIWGIHGHPCSTVITSERYEAAGKIARQVQSMVPQMKPPMGERLHYITTHRILGYPIMALTLLAVFSAIFAFGNFTSKLLGDFFYGFELSFGALFGTGVVGKLIWGGAVEGIIAGVTIALPYIAPFYFILYILEDSGYLSRVAFLMDNAMHRIGLHGKAFIPLMLGYGCNVPACMGCRIMETERERLLAGFVVTLVPCAARTVIILGLVGAFLGIQWALALYALDILVIFLLGKLAFRALPGEPTALIMEMHDYKMPHLKTVVKETWFRLEEFIKTAFPLMIVGSFVLKSLEVFNLLEPISGLLSPVTVRWLGLPAVSGIALIFGVARKELVLIMLATLLGTANFAEVLTPVQMIVFTVVAMFYIPCLATITALISEYGWRKALFITIFEIAFAIFLGGVAMRLLTLGG